MRKLTFVCTQIGNSTLAIHVHTNRLCRTTEAVRSLVGLRRRVHVQRADEWQRVRERGERDRHTDEPGDGHG
jgi:hypothetical protein